MFGSFIQGHELRAIVLFYLLGSIIAYIVKRNRQRKEIADNIAFNGARGLVKDNWGNTSSSARTHVKYDWECVFLSLGAGILSWMYLLVTMMMISFDKVSKLEPAKWM